VSLPGWARRTLRGVGIGLGVVVLGLGLLFLRALRPPDVPVTTIEVVPPDEAAQMLALVRRATNVIAHQPGADTLLQRDAHAKPHGCVRAVLTVDDTIPELFRHGVFREPGHSYRAWVRYSNGTMPDDSKPDARGMAIKLMGVEGAKLLTPDEDPEQHTQDFVMINYPTFFLSTLDDYEGFFDYQAENRPQRWFFRGVNPLDWRLREFLIAARTLYQKVPSPLDAAYFSMSAYRFGPHNIKFSARPCTDRDRPMPRNRGPNYLREALVADLSESSGCFRFMVQVQDPSKLMPIEDPSVAWKESDVPYVAIATLEIPAQRFAVPEQDRFCEQLQFSPFHALPEHRPLGRMNRVRELVYREVSKRRHAGNDVPIAEPRGWCLDLTGATCPADGGGATPTPPPEGEGS
jgi:hypothetical protein